MATRAHRMPPGCLEYTLTLRKLLDVKFIPAPGYFDCQHQHQHKRLRTQPFDITPAFQPPGNSFPRHIAAMSIGSVLDPGNARHGKLTLRRSRNVANANVNDRSIYFTIPDGRVVVLEPNVPQPTRAIAPAVSFVAQASAGYPHALPDTRHGKVKSNRRRGSDIPGSSRHGQQVAIRHVAWADSTEQCAEKANDAPGARTGILRTPRVSGPRREPCLTPSFSLEFKFRGVPYQVEFPAIENPGELLRCFERRIICRVSQDLQQEMRDALRCGYKLQSGYWGRTITRTIRGPEVEFSEAAFHAFLNCLRHDANVQIV
jgi:hypothetical protein